tara:strand:- start:584 stop:1009 length:426 start_codon:yes stop_codon:yes gene_type:complete
MKKGQMEIIGFLVIVLLLFFSLIFYFSFASKDTTDLIGEAEDNLEVSNLLAAIKLQTVCEGVQLNDAIKSCVAGGFECGEDACDLVQNEVAAIVRANNWNEEEYSFYIDEQLVSPEVACSGNTFVDDYITSGEIVRLVYCY